MTSSAHDSPSLLILVGGVAGVVGAILFLWLASRALRRLFDRPRVPLGAATYVILTALCGACSPWAASLTASPGCCAITPGWTDACGWPSSAARRGLPAACASPSPRSTPPSSPSAPEQIDSVGSACLVSADLVRMRALPSRLGVSALVRVTRVGEASRPTQNPEWLRPGSPEAPWAMGLVVRESHAASVAAAPDAGTVYQLVASPDGLVLEKSGG